MFRLMNCLLVFILVAASSPDEVLGSCFEDCENSISQLDTGSNNSDFKNKDNSHPDHDCKCPVHAHHCCNHFSLVNSFPYPSTVNMIASLKAVKHLYVEPLLSEPALETLFRPPII